MKLDRNWNEEKYQGLISYLKDNSDDKYRAFTEKLIPGTNNIIGVQVPKLRALAKKISMGNYDEYFKYVRHRYYEETILQGLTIGYIKADYQETLSLIKMFIPHITNWAICDSFCKKFNAIEERKDEFLIFLKECINSEKEYYIRFAVVMLLQMYIDEDYIAEVLDILDGIISKEYYVKMAVAWTLCECFIKFEKDTTKYLKNCKLDNFTYNKTLQKIIESNRVDRATKDILKTQKRKSDRKEIIFKKY